MSIKEMNVTFNLALATRRDEETGVHVGYCPVLNVYSQGRSSEEAVEAVASAVTLFIGACFERGILHGLLREKGFTQMAAAPIEAPESREYISVSGFDHVVERSIPLQLLASAERTYDVPCSSSTH